MWRYLVTAGTLFRPVIRFDSVTSTMDVLAALAEDGASSGTTVVAGVQTAGRGRSGRAWTTPPDTAVLMSTLLRPPRPLSKCGIFALLTGLAVAHAIEPWTGRTGEIKWPNDVLIGGRKVDGILISARPGAAPESATLIAGIGINVTTAAESLPPGATNVQLHTARAVTPAMVLQALDGSLQEVYARFCEDDLDATLVELNERLAFRGQDVTVEDGPRKIAGRVHGVTRDGGLVLNQNGRSVLIRSGELTRGPRPIEP